MDASLLIVTIYHDLNLQYSKTIKKVAQMHVLSTAT